VVLIEGGEESDIDDLQVYIKKLHPRIGAHPPTHSLLKLHTPLYRRADGIRCEALC
jgi:hypothetical protein